MSLPSRCGMNSGFTDYSEVKAAMQSLRQTWSAQDQLRLFDRCVVGAERCRRPTIKAHTIPLASLRLISDESGKIVANSSEPPRDPLNYLCQQPLTHRSIKSFTTGRWTCLEHDKIFASVDSATVDFEDERNVFLLVYRTTLRALQLGLRTVSRVAVPLVDPCVAPPVGMPEEYLRWLTQFAESGSEMIARVFFIKTQLDNMLKQGSYDGFEFRTDIWRGEPVAAGAGMTWREGPGDGTYWSGRDDILPVWLMLLPQEGHQALVTASVKGHHDSGRYIHERTCHEHLCLRPSSYCRSEGISQRFFENAIDIGISTRQWASIGKSQRRLLQEYLFARSAYASQTPKLPHIFKHLR